MMEQIWLVFCVTGKTLYRHLGSFLTSLTMWVQGGEGECMGMEGSQFLGSGCLHDALYHTPAILLMKTFITNQIHLWQF